MSSVYVQVPAQGSVQWKDPVTNAAALPATGNADGDARVTLNDKSIYVWNLGTSAWLQAATPAATSAITALNTDVSAVGPGAVVATVNSVGGSSAANINAAELLANAATSSNIVNTIVKRDGTGGFSAGPITANITGNLVGNVTGSATTFTDPLAGDVTSTQSSTVVALVGGSTASNVNAATVLANASTNLNTASTIVRRDASGNFAAGTITANLTGNASGTAASITGNLTGDITSVGMATSIATGVIVNADVNASAAMDLTKLATTTASRALVSNAGGVITAATTTAAEIGFVNGVTSGIQGQLNGKQASDVDLSALAGLATNGMIARTGSGTAATRTITGTANQIAVSNGDGISSNPTISLPSSITLAGTIYGNALRADLAQNIVPFTSSNGTLIDSNALHFILIGSEGGPELNIGGDFGGPPALALDDELAGVGSYIDFRAEGVNLFQEAVITSGTYVGTPGTEAAREFYLFDAFANENRLILDSLGTWHFGNTNALRIQDAGQIETAQLRVTEGSNASMGVSTLVAGTVVVSTTAVTANSRIFLTGQNASGTAGAVGVSARVAGTSFTILSTSVLDTRSIAWMIVEPTN